MASRLLRRQHQCGDVIVHFRNFGIYLQNKGQLKNNPGILLLIFEPKQEYDFRIIKKQLSFVKYVCIAVKLSFVQQK